MSQDRYAEALRRVLVHEGGKVDDPDDPGGRTNKGVTQATYSAWRHSKGKGVRDVYNMGEDECAAIYKERYWDGIRGDELPPGVDYVVFDGAVNSGCSQSVKWLQRAVGARDDGQLGLMTMDKVMDESDHDVLVAKICDQRMAFLKRLKHWPKYKNGWTTRVLNVKAVGQAWAMGSVGPNVAYVPNGEKKARVEDAKKLPTRTPADLITGIGSTITVGSQVVNEVKTTIAPATDLGYATHILTALTIAGVVLAIAGLAYRHYITIQKNRMARDLGNQAT
jgi:lysozyme family protein